MQVSVHDLKNRLSHYLQCVKKGELIIITSHLKPVAKLISIPKVENSFSEDVNTLLQLEGIHWNGKKPKGGKNRPKITGKTVADYIIEDRR